MTRTLGAWCGIFGLGLLVFGAVCAAQNERPDSLRSEFISLADARPVITAFADSLPAELRPAGGLDAAKWSTWVARADAGVRNRLNGGEEDTLTNLLRFGVTFTHEYRIDDEYLLRYGQSSLVNAFAENRANDLTRALASPKSWSPESSEGMARMRSFLLKRGFSFQTAAQRARIRKYLLSNLARMRDDVLRYRAPANREKQAQLFKDRGISLDTNLWPDFLLDQHFRRMAERGLLRAGSVRKVAIVGPGLDFANKEKGNDFYPPQTIQPFAVIDSLARLGIANAETIELYTLDISQQVNFHVERARENALAGKPYVVQLPWNTAARQSAEYRSNFIAFWQRLGDQIGEPAMPIAVPSAAAETQTRAVKIRPAVAQRLIPVDMNIVYQRWRLKPEQGFDLIIGTNIFVYYDGFEQSLARANIAAMLKPGGFLLSNDRFPDTVPSGLAAAPETTLVVARDPDRTDTMFCYRKQP
ncbi:MAG TPA: hypothetical protein VMG31_08425 [Verrucomicrobiae bacterium]|nr:hypothetical protein [Verrucomicrobiae bacterium]